MPCILTSLAHRGDPSHDAALEGHNRRTYGTPTPWESPPVDAPATRYPPHCDGGTGQYLDPASGEFVGACPGCLLCAPPADPDDPGLDAADVWLTVGGG